MRVAIHCPSKSPALMKITKVLCQGLNEIEVEADHIADFKELDCEKHDLVHIMNIANALETKIDLPKTGSLYHVNPESINKALYTLNKVQPDAVIVCDSYTQRQLGGVGVVTRYCPFAFDHAGFGPMPYPKEFTIGYLGWDSQTKRFSIIERAAEELGIPCIGIGREAKKPKVDYRTEKEILDFYASISCYVVASFNDGGPIPPQEALLCGRPVVTTRVGMMPEIIEDRINGIFYDGDLKSLIRALKQMRILFQDYKNKVKGFQGGVRLPHYIDMAYTYSGIFHEVLNA